MASLEGKSKERCCGRHKKEDTYKGEHEKDCDKVKFFNCHCYGHYAPACPSGDDEDEMTYLAKKGEKANSTLLETMVEDWPNTRLRG